MTAEASSPPWRDFVAASAFVDSASPGRYDVDSLSSASENFVGSWSGPTAMKMPTSQTMKTTHLARGPAARAKMERGDSMPRTDIGLQDREVPVQFPLGHLNAVVLPLLSLDLDVAVEDVLAERPQHELRLRRQLDRLTERLGQLLDAESLPLVGRQVVEVLLHRLGQLVALLYP